MLLSRRRKIADSIIPVTPIPTNPFGIVTISCLSPL